MALTGCPDCGTAISSTARTCPTCGARTKAAEVRVLILTLAAIVLAVAGWIAWSERQAAAAREASDRAYQEAIDAANRFRDGQPR